MNEIKYFSMFTGVGGFELGIKQAIGERGQCIGFSETDKYCSELLKKRFPDIINFGDARKIRPEELPDFDMLCGGFPCQSFSLAGKRKGFDDTRGTLFFEIARILKTKRPKIVFLENVKGLLNHDKGKTSQVIFQTLGELGYDIQWMVLNSKFFGVPQNRERIFIIGSLRTEPKPEILPFRYSNPEINSGKEQISSTITSGYYKLGKHIQTINEPKLKKVFELIGDTPSGISRQTDRVFNKEGISPTLTSQLGELTIPKILDIYNHKIKEESPTLTDPKHNTIRVLENSKIRRLTPTECQRLQGFSDDFYDGVEISDTQKYKQMGNAVTVNVIREIIKKLYDNDRE